MTSETPGLVARLKRLPAQLLLALVNATALLVITACILLVVVLNRVDHAAETIAGKVTDATISRLDMSPADVRSAFNPSIRKFRLCLPNWIKPERRMAVHLPGKLLI